MSVFRPIPCCLIYCIFIVSFEIAKCESSNFVLLFQDLAILGSLLFGVSLLISVEKAAGTLIGITLNP